MAGSPGHIQAGSLQQQVAVSMDWLPTLLHAAGSRPDPAFPADGIDLLPILTGKAPVVPRTLYWRFHGNDQRAIRDGDIKWLKIRNHTYLFNVAVDPQERANLKERQPEVYKRLVALYDAWNATMLPDDPAAFTHPIRGSEWADHYWNDD